MALPFCYSHDGALAIVFDTGYQSDNNKREDGVPALPTHGKPGIAAARRNLRRHGLVMAAASTAVLAGVASVAAADARTVPPETIVVGHTRDGRPIHQYRIANDHGLSLVLLDYGATMQSIFVPDRSGRDADVLVHPGDVAHMVGDARRNGRTVGRYAGRLRGGFTIDGRHFPLAANSAGVTLHGGDPGLDQAVWEGAPFLTTKETGVAFSLTSPDGSQGFPGTLHILVRYAVDRGSNRIKIGYRATTDRPTIINLTNHAYYNLAGSGTVGCETLAVGASRYVETDARRLPTGRLPAVAGTSLDFSRPSRLSDRIAASDPLVAAIGGLDHMLVLDPGGTAQLTDPRSGRTLVVSTDQPGLQVYSGNGFDGSESDARGMPIAPHAGIALEAGRLPDSPNIAAFPSAKLRPGQVYRATTTLRFGVDPESPSPDNDGAAAPECRRAG